VCAADAHKDGQRCVAREETLLTAYMELLTVAARLDTESVSD